MRAAQQKMLEIHAATIAAKGRSINQAAWLQHEKGGVADGARTHDNRNHNPGLYQLSYSHR